MRRYSLEELSDIFVRNAEQQEKNREELIERWKNEFGGEEIPECLKDEFSLPMALVSMIGEIEKLQRLVQDAQLSYLINSTVSSIAREEESTEVST